MEDVVVENETGKDISFFPGWDFRNDWGQCPVSEFIGVLLIFSTYFFSSSFVYPRMFIIIYLLTGS